MTLMLANNEAAARHLPVAHGPEPKAEVSRDRKPESRRPPSGTRLQASVPPPADRKGDDGDPYADVPCTD